MTILQRTKVAVAITVSVLGVGVVAAMLTGSTYLAEMAFSARGLLVFAVAFLVAPAVVR